MVWGNIFNSARFHGISAHCSLWKPNGKLDKPNLSSSQLPCDPQRSSNPACGMSWNRKLFLPSHVSFPGGISVCMVTKGNLYELPYRLVLFDSPPKWVPSTLPKTNSQRHLKIGRFTQKESSSSSKSIHFRCKKNPFSFRELFLPPKSQHSFEVMTFRWATAQKNPGCLTFHEKSWLL